MASKIKFRIVHEGKIYEGNMVGPALSLQERGDPRYCLLDAEVNLQSHPTQIFQGHSKIIASLIISGRVIKTLKFSCYDLRVNKGDSSHRITGRVPSQNLKDYFGDRSEILA